ncbi:MAG: ATP-binding cassette domain-containing protein, partial [Actinomycetota bacterium]|nr:ATP-binding cassette domain-containing protein [Actinomycetota bacterium]
VLELEDARLTVGERTLLEQGELWLERGEHVCLVGANGSGKSTLVETLTGGRELERGRLKIGHKVTVGYLSQHAELPDSAEITVLSHAQRSTGLSEAKTRGLLGRFLFSGEEVQKPVGGISGGEARRLAIAILITSGANLLVLDEPTNHLDVESREALEEALQRFEGTVLLISHDRALLEAIGSRTVVLAGRRLQNHDGGWASWRVAEEEREAASKRKAAPSSDRGERRAAKGPSKNRIADAKRLEREVEAAEAAMRALEDELADPVNWSEPQRSAEASKRHQQSRRELDQLYARWEQAVEKAGG